MDQLCLGCQCVSLETVGEIGPRYNPRVTANQRQIWANLTNDRTLDIRDLSVLTVTKLMTWAGDLRSW